MKGDQHQAFLSVLPSIEAVVLGAKPCPLMHDFCWAPTPPRFPLLPNGDITVSCSLAFGSECLMTLPLGVSVALLVPLKPPRVLSVYPLKFCPQSQLGEVDLVGDVIFQPRSVSPLPPKQS